MKKFLDDINSPDDIKKLSLNELNGLCAEIREFLVDNVSLTGGHLASNLGIVELTVAIDLVFDLPIDKVVFDVGHQSYVHKILSGRRDSFDSLRQFNGISGFPKRDESEYDSFNTGHSSTSISAALGLARARDLSGDNYSVIALFGDGALTGGMMYEAMNDAGRVKTPLILILNDNEMSISKNVGAVALHLRKLRTSEFYFRSKHTAYRILNKIPLIGKPIEALLRKIKRVIRHRVIPTTLFEDLGFTYIGPVDGHNISAIVPCLEYAKEEKKPVLIHVQTKKGKGYPPAENNPRKFHGVGPFDKNTGIVKPHDETYSAHFGNTLAKLAETNDKIVAVTGAMPDGTGLEPFALQFPKRFFDVGIAEQHAVTLCAGLACGGYVPVIPLYSSFLQRAYDQTLHDVCLQKLHVVFPVDHAGIVGSDGETHQGIYDISYLSHMPDMTILSPSSFDELDEMMDYAINIHNGPIAIRYPKGSTQYSHVREHFRFGHASLVKNGKDIVIFTTGRMLCRAAEVADILERKNISVKIIAFPTIKPLDSTAVIKAAAETKHAVTIEDNVKTGGLGSMIGTIIAENNINCNFKIFAFPDEPIQHGTISELDKFYGLDAETIAEDCND